MSVRGNLWPLLCLAAVPLMGCADQPVASFERPRYQSRAAQAQLDIYFQPGTGFLAGGETERLRQFLAKQVLQPTDDVILDVPSSGIATLDTRRGEAARAAVGPVPARVRLIGRPGFVNTEPNPDRVFVQVMRYDQVAVDCVNSGRNAFETNMLQPFPAMGCVNAINVARMTADLRDLTAPRELGSTDAVTAVSAIKRYQDGTTRPFPFDVNGN